MSELRHSWQAPDVQPAPCLARQLRLFLILPQRPFAFLEPNLFFRLHTVVQLLSPFERSNVRVYQKSLLVSRKAHVYIIFGKFIMLYRHQPSGIYYAELKATSSRT